MRAIHPLTIAALLLGGSHAHAVIEFDPFGAAGESNAPAIDHDPQ